MTSLRKAPLVLGLVALAMLTGCGQDSNYTVTADESRAVTINRVLRPYFEEFVQYYGKPTAEFPLHIGPLEKGTAGKCYIPGKKSSGDQIADSVFGDSTQKNRRILISAAWFERNKENHDAIQNVVFHELGHCILNRGHQKAMVKDKYGQEIPESIMYPSEFGEKPIYRENFQRYVKELFHPRAGAETTTAGGYGSKDEAKDDESVGEARDGVDEAATLY